MFQGTLLLNRDCVLLSPGRKRNLVTLCLLLALTKLVSLFATKCSPDLDAETLSVSLKEKLGLDVTCCLTSNVTVKFDTVDQD